MQNHFNNANDLLAHAIADLPEIGPEEAGDAGGVADADLNVVQGAESGGGIDGLAFVEEAPDAVEGGRSGGLAESMEVVDDRTVEEAGLGFRTGIQRRLDLPAAHSAMKSS